MLTAQGVAPIPGQYTVAVKKGEAIGRDARLGQRHLEPRIGERNPLLPPFVE